MNTIKIAPVFRQVFQIFGPLPVLPRIIIIAILLGTVGCAKIAEPQPPELHIPKAASDLSGFQRADSVQLHVSMPQQNTNGTPVTTLRQLDIYRLAEDPSRTIDQNQIPSEQFHKEADLILSIPETRFPDFGDADSISIEDDFTGIDQYTHAFRYALLFVNDKNQAAGFSNQFVITPVPIPLPPVNITAEVHEDSIYIRWAEPAENMDESKPPRISGYNVYRSEESGAYASNPANPTPLKKPEFKDVHFQFDRTYYYRISVLGSIADPLAESLLSEYLAVTPRDIFPPEPVGNFNVVMDKGAAFLLWKPSPSTDTAGYRISRLEKETGEFHSVQESLVVHYTFRDTNVLSGKTYVYTITAIDTHGNESSSDTAEITVP